MIRVVVADDHPIVRAGIVALLQDADDVQVVGQASDGETAVRLALAERPDVVLMDLRMPGIDGDQATARILAREPGVRVLILTTYESDDQILAAIEAGAAGYLLKAAPESDILAGLRATARGETALAPSAAAALVRRATTKGPTGPALSPRARGPSTRRAGQLEPSDRPCTLPQRDDGEDAPRARVREARRERPDTCRDPSDGARLL